MQLIEQTVALDFVAVTPTHATFCQHRDDEGQPVILQLPLDRWDEAGQRDQLVVTIHTAP